jgi:hypothetical protein
MSSIIAYLPIDIDAYLCYNIPIELINRNRLERQKQMFNVYLIITRKRTSKLSIEVTTSKTDLSFKSFKAAAEAIKECGWEHGKQVIIAECTGELETFEFGYGQYMRRPKGGHVYYEIVLTRIYSLSVN